MTISKRIFVGEVKELANRIYVSIIGCITGGKLLTVSNADGDKKFHML